MAVPRDLEEAFMAGRRGSVIHFAINDSVMVIDGPFRGCLGAVIAPTSIHPEVEYLVELDEGRDVPVVQSALQLVEET